MEVRVTKVSCSKILLQLQASFPCSAPAPQSDLQPSHPVLSHSVHLYPASVLSTLQPSPTSGWCLHLQD